MFPMHPTAVPRQALVSSPEAGLSYREEPAPASAAHDGIARSQGDARAVPAATANLSARQLSAPAEAANPTMSPELQGKYAASAVEERQRQRRKTFERMVRVRRGQHAQLRRRGPAGQASPGSPKGALSGMPIFGPVAGALLP
jgi:hypothetical protein